MEQVIESDIRNLIIVIIAHKLHKRLRVQLIAMLVDTFGIFQWETVHLIIVNYE